MNIRLVYKVVAMGLEYEKTVSSYDEMNFWIVEMNNTWIVGLDSTVEVKIERVDLVPV